MTDIFDLITKLRQELEPCRTGDNDTKVMDAVQTLNAIDNKLLKQANGAEQSDSNCNIPFVSNNEVAVCEYAKNTQGDKVAKSCNECTLCND